MSTNPELERKYYQPQELRYRHLRIMDLMLAAPHMSQNEMAEELGMTASRFSIIVNSPLFKLAFSEYEKQHRAKLSDVVMEATLEAIQFSRAVIRGEVPTSSGETVCVEEVPIRQMSARDILAQGHAKAVERQAKLNVDISSEDMKWIGQVVQEASKP